MMEIRYDAYMRTTLTIDDDLMSELKRRAHETGKPLKEVINNVLRTGLKSSRTSAKRGKYTCPEFSMGHLGHYDLDRALDLAEALETEEIIRKIQLRK